MIIEVINTATKKLVTHVDSAEAMILYGLRPSHLLAINLGLVVQDETHTFSLVA